MTYHNDFALVRDERIVEINSRARLYRHTPSGAEILSLENDDENKVFGITFRTPPQDSTGVAHILEHSVLCGSRKYPLKEPFVELIKGSLKTFLNAMTYPDKTCYPVASQNTNDFYHLIDVYLDAVFHPLLTEHIFWQEGWHYEATSPTEPLRYKGVVFNEMKGANASSDRMLNELSRQSLFPDTTYGVSSGGNPADMPTLSYEQFCAFHRRYYHPSNARIFFYGDDPPEQRFALLEPYLHDVTPLHVDSVVALQAPFATPQSFTHTYATDPHMPQKTMVTVNWVVGDSNDTVMALAYQILGYMLVGMVASPIRKALVESGLGEDVAGGGMNHSLRQIYFSTGLKGITNDNAPAVERIIIETLAHLRDNGIPPETMEAAINTLEFFMREQNSGDTPRGLVVMLRALTTWLHDGDPIAPIAFEAPLATIKAHLAHNEPFFERLIDQSLLQNPHRTTVLLQPDSEQATREAAAERSRLDNIRASMNDAEIAACVQATHALKQWQDTPDDPSLLATIPHLTLDDLDRVNKEIPLETWHDDGTLMLYHDVPTNGIFYLDIGFDVRVLPQTLLPYVKLFGRVLREMGTHRDDYTTLSQRIGRKTGGIRGQPLSTAIRDSMHGATWLLLRCKATYHHVADLTTILHDILLDVDLTNRERFYHIVREEKAREESAVVPRGSGYVNLRLRAHMNEADWVNELMGGVSYLLFLRQLVHAIEHDWERVCANLQTLHTLLINRSAMLCNCTIEHTQWHTCQHHVQALLAHMPAAPVEHAHWSPATDSLFATRMATHAPSEALIVPTHINYVGKAVNLYEFGYQRHGSMGVITNYLRTTWLWEQIRVKGGAYGCFCRFGRYSGAFAYVSYRDPAIVATLSVYDQAGMFLREAALHTDEITRNIIGAISHFDAYQLPDAKGFTSMIRHLTGHTPDIRQEKRDEILSTTPQQIRAFADMLDVVRDHGHVCVMGSQAAIEQANTEHATLQLQPVVIT